MNDAAQERLRATLDEEPAAAPEPRTPFEHATLQAFCTAFEIRRDATPEQRAAAGAIARAFAELTTHARPADVDALKYWAQQIAEKLSP